MFFFLSLQYMFFTKLRRTVLIFLTQRNVRQLVKEKFLVMKDLIPKCCKNPSLRDMYFLNKKIILFKRIYKNKKQCFLRRIVYHLTLPLITV